VKRRLRLVVRVMLLFVTIVRDATLQITCMYAGCLLYDMNTNISHFIRIFSHYEHLFLDCCRQYNCFLCHFYL